MIYNQQTAKEIVSLGEQNTGKSQTIPDQAMSLATLLQKHTKGHAIPMHEGQYSDDDDLPIDDNLDLVDIQEMTLKNNQKIEKIRTEVQNKKKAKADEEQKEFEEFKNFKKEKE